MMAALKLFNIFLIYCICIKFIFCLPSSSSYPNTCEDQLLSYRKFILTAVLNFEDICDVSTYDSDDRYNMGSIRSDDIRNRPEVWAFFRMLMAQFKDGEFINILKDAIIEKCKEKTQNDKRDGVVIGKKQRFHSWGGKRANNLTPLSSSDSATGYSNSNIRNSIAGASGRNSETAKYAWNN